ncbi:proline-rich receptor-like protein kinase PERK9 [Triticum aestivum]|nr:proline-rich receptor-like protein kinase PERK9 [Triticum aestivum]
MCDVIPKFHPTVTSLTSGAALHPAASHLQRRAAPPPPTSGAAPRPPPPISGDAPCPRLQPLATRRAPRLQPPATRRPPPPSDAPRPRLPPLAVPPPSRRPAVSPPSPRSLCYHHATGSPHLCHHQLLFPPPPHRRSAHPLAAAPIARRPAPRRVSDTSAPPQSPTSRTGLHPLPTPRRQVQVCELEKSVRAGRKVEEKEFVVLTELLMVQPLKLDGIEAEGKARAQRKAEFADGIRRSAPHLPQITLQSSLPGCSQPPP